MRTGTVALLIASIAPGFAALGVARGGDGPACPECPAGSRPALRVGAVAYAPSAVTIFEGIKRYSSKHGLALDYVLYSNYDALGEALRKGEVDVAWNTPLAHARYHRAAGGASRTLVMRDVDLGFRSKLIVRKDAGIASISGLAGKALVLGSRDAAEATVLPLHYLKAEGLDLARVRAIRLDDEVDLKGNPCSSEVHVLQALKEGRGQAGIVGARYWEGLKRDHPAEVADLAELWTSPAFSHCVFTAPRGMDDALAARFTALMTAMDPVDPSAAELMRLEGTREWVAGQPGGFEDLLKALADEPARGAAKAPVPAAPAKPEGS